MELSEELAGIAALARRFGDDDEELAAVIAAEAATGSRIYLCAYGGEGEDKSWLAFDRDGRTIESRSVLRDAVSIAALCELAEEVAGGGHLEELRAQLVSLRLTERPEGIEEAEEAALTLERTVGRSPRLASPAYLDEIGVAARRLENALGEQGASPFAEAMKRSAATVAELGRDVEGNYKLELG